VSDLFFALFGKYSLFFGRKAILLSWRALSFGVFDELGTDNGSDYSNGDASEGCEETVSNAIV
jgi:hypothetical protein